MTTVFAQVTKAGKVWTVLILTCIAIALALPCFSTAADMDSDWVYIGTDASGAKHYYDTTRITFNDYQHDTSKNVVVRVWEKRVPSADSQYRERELVVLNEIMCSKRMYRFIEGDTGYAKITRPTPPNLVENGTWRDKLLNIVCTIKKPR